MATYRGLDGAEMRSAAERIKATPRSEAKPIPKLRVRPVEVAGSVRARVAWTPVDHSEVRILRSDVPPPWPFGTWVSQEEMTRFGQEVTGRRVPRPARSPSRPTWLPACITSCPSRSAAPAS